ncbi:MAG TPA: hypothetical protein VKZ18_00530 [Polyangia bacterium]|nr:hypothetical protein [Polyangia bacterium]
MPGLLLDAGATVICSHGGLANATTPNPRVTLSGLPSVTLPAPWVVAGCGLTGTGAPPCVTASWIVGATRVTSQGQPLLLIDSQSICAGTGTPLQGMATQTRVTAQ